MTTFIDITKDKRVLFGLLLISIIYHVVREYYRVGGNLPYSFFSGLGIFTVNTLLWSVVYGLLLFSIVQSIYNLIEPDSSFEINWINRISIGIITGVPISVIYHLIKGDLV